MGKAMHRYLADNGYDAYNFDTGHGTENHIQGSVLNYEEIRAAVSGIDVVFNIAGLLGTTELLDKNILSNLDINILNQYCLKPILGIQDVNNDERIRFIAGCHGLEALEKKVNENPDSVAFSIFPTHIDDVIKVANQNLTMPPKTTWFDPKPLDGLVVYEFNQ